MDPSLPTSGLEAKKTADRNWTSVSLYLARERECSLAHVKIIKGEKWHKELLSCN